MKDSRPLMDAFAEARRSWDDLITLQPDVYAGGGNLDELNLAELSRRVETHQAAIDALSDVLHTEPEGPEPHSATKASAGRGESRR
jgi:hypothetical protein